MGRYARHYNSALANPDTDGLLMRTILVAGAVACGLGIGQVAANRALEPSQGPDPTQIDIAVEPLASGFNNVVGLYDAQDGSGRLFVVEKRGLIHILADGQRRETPFLDLTDRVRTTNGVSDERGLLGLAFAPDYATSGIFYVDYVGRGTGGGDTSYISRFHVTADPNVGDPDSEQRLVTVAQPFTNHNGGQIVFGPGGFLYIGFGDGGSRDDPDERGQDKSTLLGKLLRIDVSGGGATYTVPETNPFVGEPPTKPEIWAYGLRNPWRFSFDRATGDLYIGDVGQDRIEEIDYQPASSPGGENYGWNIMEGSDCLVGNNCRRTGLTLPVAEYSHSIGCSVTGGFVYRGERYPALQGAYLYADYCSRRMWALSRDDQGEWRNAQVGMAPFDPASFGEDEQGELYVVGAGSVGRIVLEGAPTLTPGTPSPSATATATSSATTATATETATLPPTGTGSPTPTRGATATATRTQTAEPTILYLPALENR
jgi:glucose/arabinose dehydrogenase